MKNLFHILGVSLLASVGTAAPLFETLTLFPNAPRNRPNYRIPALACAPNGDLLVFAEKRNDGIGDIGNHDLVMKRSTDRGRTWSAEAVIYDDGERTCADPTVCIDQERGRIFLFFLQDKKRFAYFASDDSGKTWRGPTVIHAAVTKPEWDRIGLAKDGDVASTADPESAKSSYAKRWAVNWVQRYGVGPGAGGVQLTRGPKKGRLLVPARHLEDDGKGKHVTFSHVVMSDDHGATWRLGPNTMRHGNECRMIVLPSGDVMINMRNANPADQPDNSRRLVAISHDGGDTWPEVYRDDGLVSTTVHAGLRVYERVAASVSEWPLNVSDRGLVLFSNPASPIREDAHPYGRYNLTVRWSRDNAQTWSAGRVIYAHPSSYSDLAVLDDGTVGIIYERGPKGSDHYWDELQFARFNLEWLFAPPHTAVK